MDDLPRFIDFEATSLDLESRPVEVAWSYPDGSVESHLISPAGVQIWTSVTMDKAVHIHGITQAMLLRDGRTPRWVIERMLAGLLPGPLHSDAAPFDSEWLKQLFDAAGVECTQFEVVTISKLPELAKLDVATMGKLSRKARRRAGGRHRAGVDVRFLVELYRMATGEARVHE